MAWAKKINTMVMKFMEGCLPITTNGTDLRRSKFKTLQMKWNIFKKSKPNGAKPIVVRSGDDVINCEIETPQFHGSQYRYHLHKQRGTYNKKTMKFEPFEWKNGDHSVQFHSQDDFQKAYIRSL